MSAPYLSDKFAGTRFRGGNLVPRLSDNPVTVYSPWYSLNYNAALNIGDARAFITDQLDAAEIQGINCIRLIMNHGLRVGTYNASRLTQQQLADYLDWLCYEMWVRRQYFYPAISDGYGQGFEIDNGYATSGQIATYIAEVFAYLNSKINFIGADVSQEINASSTALGLVATWISSAQNSCVSPKPVTCSFFVLSNDYLPGGGSYPGATITTAGADLLDIHVYYYPGGGSISDFSTLLAGSLPVIIGESGIRDSGKINGGVIATPSEFYTFLALLSNHARNNGGIVWSITDFSVDDTQSWGFVDLTFIPKVAKCAGLATILKTVKPYDATQDLFAIVEVVPTIVSRTLTSVSLSWSAAVGGSGTKTYSPKYARADVKGFPTEDWTAASPTVSTSATFAVPNQRLVFRIDTSSASA